MQAMCAKKPYINLLRFKNVYRIGMAVGSFLFGSISDTTSRKKSIAVSTGIVFCASAGLSFAQTNFLINLSVFVLGLG